ncbi:unnamed protein product [Trichobilharzia szidati]|nr:unnamed protein product [Trichobilharzia szidati]
MFKLNVYISVWMNIRIHHYAARNNHKDICDLLITAGANIFAKTKSDGATPAHRAAYTGRLNILQLLVDKGGVALLELGDGDGRNCLHHAYRGNQQNVISWILENYPHLSTMADSKGILPISLSPS